MPKPTTVVEIAFDAGYTGTPTWTDVTAYALHPAGGLDLGKWRTEETSVCPPSRCSFVLDNRDGRFTPGKTGGAHYPNIKKGRRIRVRSTANAVTTTRFLGYIDDWAVEWPGHVSTFATCLVTASSRTARLGRPAAFRSIVEEEILRQGPAAYYTLSEPTGSTQANDTSGNSAAPLTYYGTGAAVAFGEGTGPPTDGLTAAEFTAAGLKGPQSVPMADGVTLAFWCSVTGTGDLLVMADDGGDFLFDLTTSGILIHTVAPSGNVIVQWSDVDSVTLSPLVVTPAMGVTRVVVTYDDTAAKLYVNGVEVDSAATTASTSTIRAMSIDHNGVGSTFASHLALYPRALTPAEVLADYEAGADGFADETPAARLTRYAEYAGIPTGETSFETGDVPDLAHIDIGGKTALEAMRVVEETEGGVLFDAGDGTLKFQDRSHRYATTSAFTVPASVVVTPPTPVLDDQLMANDITATGSTGIRARVPDTTSIDDYGPYRQSLDLATSNADEPFQAASWRVGRYAEPTVRLSTVKIHLNKCDAALTAAIMAAEPGTKFTLTGLSATNAPATSMDLFIEGMAEHIDASEHTVTLHTSPAELFDVWILGDATYGVLGSTTRLGY